MKDPVGVSSGGIFLCLGNRALLIESQDVFRMLMKKLLFILALLIGIDANAQGISYGVTSRLGAFKTIGDSDFPDRKTGYGLGLQAALGVWVKLPLAPKNELQLTLLQTGERQNAGEVTLYDVNRSPITDATVTDRNLAVVLQVVYLRHLTENWSVGIGTGAKYEYLSKAKIKSEYRDWNYVIKSEDTVDNTYRRNLTLHLPIEAQYALNDRFALVSQVQLQLSNRLNSSETDNKQHDLGFSVGVNYILK